MCAHGWHALAACCAVQHDDMWYGTHYPELFITHWSAPTTWTIEYMQRERARSLSINSINKVKMEREKQFSTQIPRRHEIIWMHRNRLCSNLTGPSTHYHEHAANFRIDCLLWIFCFILGIHTKRRKHDQFKTYVFARREGAAKLTFHFISSITSGWSVLFYSFFLPQGISITTLVQLQRFRFFNIKITLKHITSHTLRKYILTGFASNWAYWKPNGTLQCDP